MQWTMIQIEGHLDSKWAEWFEGFDFAYTDTGDTLLTGCAPDQAALYGLIAKLRDLGVTLVSVKFDLLANSDTQARHPKRY